MNELKLRLQDRLRKRLDLTETILERIRSAHGTLTRAERQLADTLTENYPVSGLGSITRIAEAAGVSTPTVARTVRKLGFGGFPELQDALRQELEARISDPIKKRAHWAEGAPEGHILNRFTEKVTRNLQQTVARVRPGELRRRSFPPRGSQPVGLRRWRAHNARAVRVFPPSHAGHSPARVAYPIDRECLAA